jgi:hypothetical protein
MGLSQLFRRFNRDERGNVLIMAGLAASSLVGAAGLGTDATQWFLWKRQIQMAADAGALGAAYTIGQGTTQITTPAMREILRNTSKGAYAVEYIGTPPRTGAFAGDKNAAEVVLTTQQRLPFSGMFLSSPPVIRARAVASKVIKMDNCVISLATTGIGVRVQGSGNVQLGCGVAANSSGAQAVYLQGGGQLNASTISAVGQIDPKEGSLAPGTELYPNYLPQTDPFGPAGRNLQVPTEPAGCTDRNYSNQPGTANSVSPGRYCGGMTLRGNTHFAPGVYIIDGGNFNLGSQSVSTGDGVTFILTGNGTNTASLQVAGGASATFKAPTAAQSTQWNGILFFQDPNGNVSNSQINGGGSMNFFGAVYMPRGDISYSGSAGVTAQCVVLIANRVDFSGESRMTNNCPKDLRDEVAFRVIRVVE